jgi:hypothetical protein
MAVVPGTVVGLHSFSSPHGPQKDSSGNPYECCVVDATFTGTYASADDASITTLGAKIAEKLRNGKTVTVVSAGAVGAGKTSAGVVCGANGVSMSSTTLLCTLTQADLSTSVADGAITVSEPISFAVSYILS